MLTFNLELQFFSFVFLSRLPGKQGNDVVSGPCNLQEEVIQVKVDTKARDDQGRQGNVRGELVGQEAKQSSWKAAGRQWRTNLA